MPNIGGGNQSSLGRAVSDLSIQAIHPSIHPGKNRRSTLGDLSPQCVHIDSSSHSHPPRPLQKLTFVLNAKGVVLGTGSRVAVNSHVDSSRDWLFAAPFAAHSCPAQTKEDPELGDRLQAEKNSFLLSALCQQRFGCPVTFGHRNILLR